MSDPPAGSSALVTGGAGFIGSHLVEGLLAAGASRVCVVDDLSLGSRANLAGALERPEVELTVADAADAELLARSVAEDGPFDHCYNLAVIPLPHSLEHPRENVDRNVSMTSAVCELGAPVLSGASCSSPFGGVRHGTERADRRGAPAPPAPPYAAAKAATDLVALSYAKTFEMDVVLVRPFNTYGERQNDGMYAGLIPAVIRAVLAREPVTVHGDGEQTRDMAHVCDTVHGTLLAAAADGVSPGRDVQPRRGSRGLGQRARAAAPGGARLPRASRPARPRPPGEVRRLLADTRRARERLGHVPSIPLDVGLERTVAWYLSRAAA